MGLDISIRDSNFQFERRHSNWFPCAFLNMGLDISISEQTCQFERINFNGFLELVRCGARHFNSKLEIAIRAYRFQTVSLCMVNAALEISVRYSTT